ncbi:UvrD-helicase domain-containing protein [Tessaracoccus sp. HDW20]|uniref:UvrD-helicase domain-containing protein n=1 Tax=Tessaracoccus coleopterorum TaxID=2714950 RepID=UPI0018D2E06B|nr:UvrD-helicase domain-containing protein [Tessaracoccus coleopterorum]NHB83702.1 UvrD-helicase domain-containing protein [Tessaracoccus coleopterorum]
MTLHPIRRRMLETPASLSTPFRSLLRRAARGHHGPLEPAVIIAGAGSGKTTVMAARVVWLVGTRQVSPEQVLGLTFTRKAAAELAERVATALERAGVLTGPTATGRARDDLRLVRCPPRERVRAPDRH